MPAAISTKVPISNEAKNAIGFNKRRDIVSPFEICPSTHKVCRDYVTATSLTFKKLGKVPQGLLYDSPCSKKGFNKYRVTCKRCKQKLAEVYSVDRSLTNWRGFRYFSWHDREEWHGTRGVNIKDDVLRVECCCDIALTPKDNWVKRKTMNHFSIKEIE